MADMTDMMLYSHCHKEKHDGRKEHPMARFTKDTKLKVILENPEATAILQKYYP